MIFFTLEEDEEITMIAGTYEDTTVITCLTIGTSLDVTHGPFGTPGSKSFSLPVAKGKVIGFFGSYGDYLNTLGVIVQPACHN
ncbi:hypothetical protein L6452_35886 [Arctium lappa]|uniref:Uncharacterized protein n=1 Tax=Arctium lappa TaxID=4217 RepID=A0ACB8Y8V7_ARCLA|nr:hypothetical protein L6452_35886 [Arctium lappa]